MPLYTGHLHCLCVWATRRCQLGSHPFPCPSHCHSRHPYPQSPGVHKFCKLMILQEPEGNNSYSKNLTPTLWLHSQSKPSYFPITALHFQSPTSLNYHYLKLHFVFKAHFKEWAQISQQPSFKRTHSWATLSMPSDVFYAPTGTWGTNFLSCSVAKSWPTFATPMNCGRPGLPVLHHFLEFAQVHVHWISDAIQTSHPLSPSFPSAFNLSQHQGLFQWISSSHQVAKVLEFH